MNNTIGIDISKDTLDVHRLTDGQHRQFLNGKAGHTQLLKWIKLRPAQLVIFEATGAYHRQLERALGRQSVPFVKVNPKQARRFAQASGKLVKTDRVDCEMLAKMGAALQLVPQPPFAEILYDLKELLSARRALIKDRTAAKARKATVSNALVKQQLEKRLRQIESRLSVILSYPDPGSCAIQEPSSGTAFMPGDGEGRIVFFLVVTDRRGVRSPPSFLMT